MTKKDLKVTDLMIGDWVNFNGTFDKVKEILFVDKPKHMGYCASFAASTTLFPVQLDKITPIKVTQEFLEKNLTMSTDYMGNKYFIDDKCIFFVRFNQICMKTNDINHELVICNCDYVDELQHFIKQLHIEKDIEL